MIPLSDEDGTDSRCGECHCNSKPIWYAVVIRLPESNPFTESMNLFDTQRSQRFLFSEHDLQKENGSKWSLGHPGLKFVLEMDFHHNLFV